MSIPLPNPDCQKLLAEALKLSRSLVASSTSPEAKQRRQERLREIQTQLKTFAHPIHRDAGSPQAIPIAVRKAFVQAVALVTRFADVGGSQWQGSIPSPTLSHYRPDPIPAQWTQVNFIPELCDQFELPHSFANQIKQQLKTVDYQIEQQRQIIAATWTALSLQDIKNEAQQQALFENLFGIQIPIASLDCIHTDLQIYFCLNYQGQQLYQQNSDQQNTPIPWEQFSPNHQEQLKRFLASLGQFSFEQFQRFPIFGACDALGIDQSFCNRIAQQLQISPSEVLQTLTRAISVIPTHKAEAFLVHDIWGHHWQFVLTNFQSDYNILSRCDEPLRARESAYTAEGPLMYQDLFTVQNHQVVVNEAAARLFFHAEVQQRLGLMFTHLLGELLADAAEFKWIWDHQDKADQLLSSSLFKTEPAKLDLSLLDLDFLFLRVLKPLLEIKLSALTQSPVEIDLLTHWQGSGPSLMDEATLQMSLKAALAQVYQIFIEEHTHSYLPRLEQGTGRFSQIAMNLLYLQNIVNSLYTDDWVRQHGELPFQDLLLVFISRYCAGDSYAEFWAIDDVLAHHFLPCWQRLLSTEQI